MSDIQSADQVQAEPEPESPLQEADARSLDELWKRIDKHLVAGMPQEITNEDMDGVVDYYRKLRVRFKNEEALNIKPGRRKGTEKLTVDKVLAKQAAAVKDIVL